MSSLVTGATGLVGSNILYLLTQNGVRLKALKRSTSSVEFVKWVFGLYTSDVEQQFELIDWVDADLLDYQSLLEATRGVRTVYHAGAVVSFNPKDSHGILATNVTGTSNLVDACLENGVKELCYASSVAALGGANERGIIDEQCKWDKSRGQTAYARSKFMGENQVWRAHEMGLRTVVVNPTVILGAGRWSSGSGQLFTRVKKGMPFYTNGVSGYVDVRDVANIMVKLMQTTTISGERFVINSQNMSYHDLFCSMAKNFGKKPPRYGVPKWGVDVAYPLIWLGGVLTGRGSALSKANLKSAFLETNYSSRKIADCLGYEFIPVDESVRFICSTLNQAQP